MRSPEAIYADEDSETERRGRNAVDVSSSIKNPGRHVSAEAQHA